MCGILGQINFKKLSVDKDKFKESLNLQEHRGPDDSDMYIDENFIFGHRRLSIIDLDSHVKQPMISDCGNYVLVFNVAFMTIDTELLVLGLRTFWIKENKLWQKQ